MISLIAAFTILIVGYIVYGRFTEKVFDADGKSTPAITVNDGVDCVPMKTKHIETHTEKEDDPCLNLLIFPKPTREESRRLKI